METVKVDARGALVIPARFRKKLGIDANSLMLLEERDGKLILRPAIAVAVEKYTPERQAEFILNNAIDAEDYARATDRVRAMGLDPELIPHERPPGADSRLS